MNQRDVARIDYELTFFFANLLWIHNPYRGFYLFFDFLMNSLDVSQIHYEFTVYIVNLVRILVVLRWLSMNSVAILPYFEFTIVFANLLIIYYLYRGYIKKSLGVSRVNYKCTIFFTISQLIHYRIANSVSVSRIQFLFREFIIYYANLPWNHFRFREVTIYFATELWIDFLFQEFITFYANYGFTFCCTISLFISQKFYSLSISRIHYSISHLFRKFTINQLSISPVYLEFTIYSANSLWILHQFCELTLKQIYYEFTMNSTMNSVGVSRIYY